MLLDMLGWGRREEPQPEPVAMAMPEPPQPPARPAPAKLVENIDRAMKRRRKRPLAHKSAPWIVHYWLRDYVTSDETTGVWKLSGDVVDDMRAWCLLQDIKPAPAKEFLSVLASSHNADFVDKERPWKLNPFDHGHAMQRLIERGEKTDRPVVYFFYLPEGLENAAYHVPGPDFGDVSDVQRRPDMQQRAVSEGQQQERRAA